MTIAVYADSVAAVGRLPAIRVEEPAAVTNNPVPARLKALRLRAGLSMADVAKALGYRGASGYQRYEDATRPASNEIPVAMARTLAAVFAGRGDPPITEGEVMALADAGFAAAVSPAFAGYAEAGVFRAASIRPVPPQSGATVPADPRFPAVEQRLWMARGDSMDNAAMPDGTWLVGVRYSWFLDTHGALRNGTLVIVERRRFDGQEVETSAREFFMVDGVRHFRPRSRNPDHKAITGAGAGTSEQTGIVAVIVAAMTMFAV